MEKNTDIGYWRASIVVFQEYEPTRREIHFLGIVGIGLLFVGGMTITIGSGPAPSRVRPKQSNTGERKTSMLSRPEKPDCLDTPGLNWRPRADRWIAVWIARADLVKRGFAPKTATLWKGLRPTADEWKTISSACIRLQNEMLEWSQARSIELDPLRLFDDTIDSLIAIYLNDPDSPFQGRRYRVKLSYESRLRTISATVGKVRISSLTFRDFKRWYESYRKPLKEGGGVRVGRAHMLMTQLRVLFSYGDLAKLPGCKEVRETLAKMEFTAPKKRETFVTAEQAIAIRLEAHRQGLPSIALAQAIMYELMVRQKDVIGEYVPMDEPGVSAVLHHRRKWLYGITYEEISQDLILTHRLSKSLRGRDAINDPAAGKIESFDLKAYPMVMDELQHIQRGSGPLVVRESTDRPWDSKSFNRAWRKIANTVGIPKNVQNRDSRAGGITESLDAGAEPDMVRRHAGHSQIGTTMIYSRNSLQAKAEVVELRLKKRSKAK